MSYFLRYKYDRKEPQKVRILPFATEAEAVINACSAVAAETGWDFEVLNDRNEVAMDDGEIRGRCKQIRMP